MESRDDVSPARFDESIAPCSARLRARRERPVDACLSVIRLAAHAVVAALAADLDVDVAWDRSHGDTRSDGPNEVVGLELIKTVLAVALGMANPRPSFPPDCDTMNVLTPTTSPRIFTSGPPEFPGLIGASVCT